MLQSVLKQEISEISEIFFIHLSFHHVAVAEKVKSISEIKIENGQRNLPI